ncbi:protein AMN1 homolog [Dreissena polymorpha]|uniref:F-box/LRR-repeat protein 15-like leucin rich repeat domain-containing protein n=1 Tax=Dreissena polymorpha TaxID=45954 RepID=A0A9D4CKU5_DREPO|nr:protein AMN1 homolog [Dreissena polymorpha]KAH3726036.1 hypothetical protein DPMN_051891 [Dreissena polymorpha]
MGSVVPWNMSGKSDKSCCTVTKLLDGCIHTVICNWPQHVDNMAKLPANLKEKCTRIMSLRGLLTDDNIGKILHSKVKVLDLSGCELSDRGLAAIRTCTQLQKLDLNANKRSQPRTTITAEGISQVARCCPHLQTVYLRRCSNVSDQAIETIARCCPQLRLLNVSDCRDLTSRAFEALGEHSKFLRGVNASHTQICDSGVLKMVSGPCGKTLRELDISGCERVTDDAVEAVLQFCPQIDIFLFHGCRNITEQSRQALEDLTMSRSSPMKQVTWTIY